MTTTPASSFPMKRLKYVVSLRRSAIRGGNNERPYVGLENIESWTGRLVGDVARSDRAESSSSDATTLANTFEPGDVLFGKLRPYLAKAWVAEFPGRSTTELLVMEPVEAEPRFLKYICLSHTFVDAVDESTFGSKMPRAEWGAIGSLSVPVPPLAAQRVIADYLDRETALIDALIAAKERLLGLLSEKRRALIARVVTRGLDPDVSLRDSGIPWLGEIPVRWEMTRLKFVARVQTGIALGKNYAGQETTELPYLRVANVQDGFIDLSEVKTMDVPDREAASAMLRSGDVLMNEGGDADKLGRGAIWNGSIDPCLHQNHVFALRPMSLSSEWLSTWAGSEFAKAYFETRAKQSTNLASISSTNLLELPISVPPDDEQHAITNHITRETAKLAAVRKATELTIALLKERRSALVAAAVTGQIDVEAAA